MLNSLTARIVLALFLAVGFYGLALGSAGGLLFLVYAQVALWDVFSLRLSIIAVIGAAVILWSILPRLDRFEPPGPLLTSARHPDLFAEIERVSADVRQPMPAEVYLIPDVNAFVMARGGFMGIGSKQVMGIGLALLASVTTTQLRATLAHEFGHYHGGDTKLGPWVYKARVAMIRTVEGLGGVLRIPFWLYAMLFLLITQAVSRRQEYKADQLAAQTYGVPAIADALRKISGAGPAFEGFWANEMIPVLSQGYQPPLVEGFRRFVEHQEVASAINEIVEEQLKGVETDPFDTHPSLMERLTALGDPAEQSPTDDQQAIQLLDDITNVEREIYPSENGEASLKAVSWEEVGQTVLVPMYQEIVRDDGSALKGVTVRALPIRARGLLGLRQQRPDDVDEEEWQAEEGQLPSMGGQLVGMALVSILAARGWTVESLPGEPVRLTQGENTILPFSAVEELVSGEISPDQWQATSERAGIADVDLVRMQEVKTIQHAEGLGKTNLPQDPPRSEAPEGSLVKTVPCKGCGQLVQSSSIQCSNCGTPVGYN